MLPALFLCFLCYSVTLQHDFLCEGFLETSSGCRGYLAIFSNATLLAWVEFHGIPPSETRGWCHGFLCNKAEFLFLKTLHTQERINITDVSKCSQTAWAAAPQPYWSRKFLYRELQLFIFSQVFIRLLKCIFFFMRSFSKVAHSNIELAAQNNKCH